MNTVAENKTYLPFLDGIKGLACTSVFLGHYFIAFCVKDLFLINSFVYRLGEFIFSGPFAVSLFCMISGFLAGKKSICCLRDFIKACLKRFLRFELPITITILFIMLLNDGKLFAMGELLATKLENKRILGQFVFKTDYLSLIKKPFWSFWTYDNPLWMIGQLFIGGIIVYMKSYVYSLLKPRIPPKKQALAKILAYAILFLSVFFDTIIFAVIFGAAMVEFSQTVIRLSPEQKKKLQLLRSPSTSQSFFTAFTAISEKILTTCKWNADILFLGL